MSRSGVFIRTIRIPQIGRVLRLPDGRQVPVTGTVVRSYRAPGALRALVPSGFALNFSEMPPPEYDEFASHL